MEPAEFIRELNEYLDRLSGYAMGVAVYQAWIAPNTADRITFAKKFVADTERLQAAASELPDKVSQLRNEVWMALEIIRKHVWRRIPDAPLPNSLHEEAMEHLRVALSSMPLADEVEQLKKLSEWRWLPDPPAAPSSDGKPVDGNAGQQPAPARDDSRATILNDTLLGILKALDGKAMGVEELARVVTGGEQARLYRAGLKTTLKAQGHVDHVRGIGYFRPDKPPADRVLPAAKLGAKK